MKVSPSILLWFYHKEVFLTEELCSGDVVYILVFESVVKVS